MKKLVLAAVLALAAAAMVVAVATAKNGNGHKGAKALHAHLDGYQEVLTLSTEGQGKFRAKIRNGSVDYKLSYSGLNTAVSAAHIHLGRPAVNGGVIAFLCGGSKPACPANGEEVTGTILPADVVGPAAQGIDPGEFDEFVRALKAKATYVNVHTADYTGGEIRGAIGGGHGHHFGNGHGRKGHDRD